MAIQDSFHAGGSRDFLGLRTCPRGNLQIVYDDGADQRIVWRVAAQHSSQTRAQVAAALREAVEARYVVPTLFHALKKHALNLELV